MILLNLEICHLLGDPVDHRRTAFEGFLRFPILNLFVAQVRPFWNAWRSLLVFPRPRICPDVGRERQDFLGSWLQLESQLWELCAKLRILPVVRWKKLRIRLIFGSKKWVQS